MGDMVPSYGTSIEGCGVTILSPDESEVLLVWEYGAWETVSGAVDPGESFLQGGKREAREEAGVTIDDAFSPVLVGGYNKGRARDGIINDNFHAVVMRAKTKKLELDGVEIELAHWFNIDELLKSFDGGASGRIEFESGFPGKNTIGRATLRRIHNWRNGKCLPLTIDARSGEIDF